MCTVTRLPGLNPHARRLDLVEDAFRTLPERYLGAPAGFDVLHPRFAVLPGLSHWIPDEAPDALAELILDRVRG